MQEEEVTISTWTRGDRIKVCKVTATQYKAYLKRRKGWAVGRIEYDTASYPNGETVIWASACIYDSEYNVRARATHKSRWVTSSYRQEDVESKASILNR